MNTKYIFRNLWTAVGATALLLSVAATTACSDDDEVGAPYFRLENNVVSSKLVSNPTELGFNVAAIVKDPTVELIRYDVRSNSKWSVECSAADASWLQIHPTEGEGDGIVRFCATDNDATTPRATTVVFRYANGHQTEVTLAVKQLANLPYITIYVDKSDATQITAGRAAAHYEVEIASNVEPFYAMPQVDWATFTEIGNGKFSLDLAAYPDPATTLERTNVISVKGSGKYSAITAKLNILQTIAPQITVVSEDIAENELPPFAASSPAAFTFKVQSNWAWTAVSDDPWCIASPSSGEADKEYTVTVTVTKNAGAARNTHLMLTTSEVLGTTAKQDLRVSQEGNSGSQPDMEGLTSPVKWFFNGAAGTDYTAAKEQFEVNNSLQAASGVGRLSYTHVYRDDKGQPSADCTRKIGGTGQPYITGAWPGDFWLFEVPVKYFKAGTKVRFTGSSRISGTGQKYWRLEYKDGSWKPASELQTVDFLGETISYTHIMPTANMTIDATVTFSRSIADGEVQFRFVCAANCTGGGSAISAPNGGTIRWASDVANGFNDSPIIQVVE
ncbi:MAG: BACON domain-containing protein [Alistipes sp.]